MSQIFFLALFAVYRMAYYQDLKNTPDLYERLFTLPRNLSGSLKRSVLRSFAQLHTYHSYVLTYSIPDIVDIVGFEGCKN